MLSAPLPVEGVVVGGEALHHEVLDNDEVIHHVLPGYLQQANQPHLVSLPGHGLRALDASADGVLQNLQRKRCRF